MHCRGDCLKFYFLRESIPSFDPNLIYFWLLPAPLAFCWSLFHRLIPLSPGLQIDQEALPSQYAYSLNPGEPSILLFIQPHPCQAPHLVLRCYEAIAKLIAKFSQFWLELQFLSLYTGQLHRILFYKEGSESSTGLYRSFPGSISTLHPTTSTWPTEPSPGTRHSEAFTLQKK